MSFATILGYVGDITTILTKVISWFTGSSSKNSSKSESTENASSTAAVNEANAASAAASETAIASITQGVIDAKSNLASDIDAVNKSDGLPDDLDAILENAVKRLNDSNDSSNK